ncbi:hypothetical protein BQ8794_600004 [Mesorhizobium prunaredense]|uniref:Uncharacterized protein n=1 Tax=Mesorhizobium prunaredense TaxID=1631249 RepID=A0A1R3VGQ9_9HYPH|nr:hypothetical protein BQ8794_600004 [Mesorhizobium prunaredense]
MIHPGDTQQVEFFKNPNERVIIARQYQFQDRRDVGSADAATGRAAAQKGDDQQNFYRGINISSPEGSRESQTEIEDRTQGKRRHDCRRGQRRPLNPRKTPFKPS